MLHLFCRIISYIILHHNLYEKKPNNIRPQLTDDLKRATWNSYQAPRPPCPPEQWNYSVGDRGWAIQCTWRRQTSRHFNYVYLPGACRVSPASRTSRAFCSRISIFPLGRPDPRTSSDVRARGQSTKPSTFTWLIDIAHCTAVEVWSHTPVLRGNNGRRHNAACHFLIWFD